MNDTISVDLLDPTPPYEQLRRQLTLLIETGQLEPGDRLAPVRQLARDLGLASGTVARAYRELESAGLIQTRRGAGTTVARRPRDPEGTEHLLRAAADEYAARARALGVSADTARRALDESLRRTT
ncbi:GntR family transcriptional regulator [Janibacter sp. GXQ6167]|uniref:GntR family transcriptional regulator n=1 Tax=Janibacter sp. GXQ6167 TaxID=3240791 RepID=UPI00352535E2